MCIMLGWEGRWMQVCVCVSCWDGQVGGCRWICVIYFFLNNSFLFQLACMLE